MIARAALLLAAIAVCGGCAVKQSAVVVLLPDPEGGVGRANVENTSGGVDLVSRRDATRVKTNEKPTSAEPMSEAEVQRLFGAALEALPPAPQRFVLNFRFQTDELTDEARALVPEILNVVGGSAFAIVVVTGHTDTMGTLAANYELGLKRAVMVRNLLVASGLDERQIEVSSLGETDLLVKTPDEAAEPRNRRVDITIR